MPKKVGIILVNYKDYAARFLAACRDSLRAQDYPADLIHIYLVDNAATPESGAYLKNNYPEALILPRSDGNYAAANNLGFHQAILDGCEYLVTVNMDTEMCPDWLSGLARALEENPTAAIAQSKILLYPKDPAGNEPLRINSLGNIIHFLGFGFTDGYGELDREISGYPEIKGYASGCSFIIRAAAFQKVGAYDEEYYMYHDDLELSLKVKLAGYKIILAPQSVVFHKYEFSRSVGMVYYMERNRYLAILSFYPPYLLFFIGLPWLLMDLGMAAYSLVNHWFKAELKIYGYFFRFSTYARIIAARRKIRNLSVIPFATLARDFAGRIEFQEIANPLLKYLVNPAFNLYWQIIKKII
ncbi:MAG: glycosyltransferase family 2 protein [Patescibacteria group bacterium]